MDLLQPMLIRNSASYTGYLQKQASLYYGLHITDPTLDKDLIDLCLSIPFNIYHNRKGTRNLVAQGLKELIPEEIRKNQVKGYKVQTCRLTPAGERT